MGVGGGGNEALLVRCSPKYPLGACAPVHSIERIEATS